MPSNIFATGNHLSISKNFPDSDIDEPIKPKKLQGKSKSNLYSSCRKNSINSNICNFNRQYLNLIDQGGTINDCSYDSKCDVLYNTEYNQFHCLPKNKDELDEMVFSRSNNDKNVLSFHKDSQIINENGVELQFNENNNDFKDALVELLNDAENKTINLNSLSTDYNNIFIYLLKFNISRVLLQTWRLEVSLSRVSSLLQQRWLL